MFSVSDKLAECLKKKSINKIKYLFKQLFTKIEFYDIIYIENKKKGER